MCFPSENNEWMNDDYDVIQCHFDPNSTVLVLFITKKKKSPKVLDKGKLPSLIIGLFPWCIPMLLGVVLRQMCPSPSPPQKKPLPSQSWRRGSFRISLQKCYCVITIEWGWPQSCFWLCSCITEEAERNACGAASPNSRSGVSLKCFPWVNVVLVKTASSIHLSSIGGGWHQWMTLFIYYLRCSPFRC